MARSSKLQQHQEAVLDIFSPQIRTAAEYVVRTIRLKPGIELDDALQEARILVLSYAGLLSSGRMHGCLVRWIATADDLRSVVVRQLKVDLAQHYGRMKRPPCGSLDLYSYDRISDDSQNDPRDSTVALLDFIDEEPRLRLEYPCLMMRFDGLTENDMIKVVGKSRQTIDRYLAEERKRAESDRYLASLKQNDIGLAA